MGVCAGIVLKALPNSFYVQRPCPFGLPEILTGAPATKTLSPNPMQGTDDKEQSKQNSTTKIVASLHAWQSVAKVLCKPCRHVVQVAHKSELVAVLMRLLKPFESKLACLSQVRWRQEQ